MKIATPEPSSMSKTFKKLNLRNEAEIVVLDAPESFEHELDSLGDVTVFRSIPTKRSIDFALVFAPNRQCLTELAPKIIAACGDDAVLWFAYPKKSSRKYSSDISRGSGWEILGQAGFEGVRQVALDEDWSALRFRRVDYIKSFNRDPSRAMSAAGRKRLSRR